MQFIDCAKKKLNHQFFVEYKDKSITLLSDSIYIVFFRLIFVSLALFLIIAWCLFFIVLGEVVSVSGTVSIHILLFLCLCCIFICFMLFQFGSIWELHKTHIVMKSLFLGKVFSSRQYEFSSDSKLYIDIPPQNGGNLGNNVRYYTYLPIFNLKPSYQDLNLGLKALSASNKKFDKVKIREFFEECKKIADFLNISVEVHPNVVSLSDVELIVDNVFGVDSYTVRKYYD